MKKPRQAVRPPAKGFRVDNRTKWRTDDLRRLIAAVVRRQGGPPRGFVVRVNTGNYSGWVYRIGGREMVVRVPAPPRPEAPLTNQAALEAYADKAVDGAIPTWRFGGRLHLGPEVPRVNARAVASVVAHELAHLRGLRGERDMRSSKCLGHKPDPSYQVYAWADEYLIRLAEPVKKERLTGAPADDKKRQAAEGKVLEWERKAKLAATKLKQWRGKVRYYEKKAAAQKVQS